MRTHRHEFARTVNAKLFVSNLQTRHAQTQNSYTDKTICAYLFYVCVQMMKRAMYYTNEYFRFLYIIFWSKASLSALWCKV